MKLKNLTTLLTNALGSPVNQSMLAQSLGITRQTISNRVKNDSELTVSELAKIEKYFNVNITNQALRLLLVILRFLKEYQSPKSF